jgi:hypothetical protein
VLGDHVTRGRLLRGARQAALTSATTPAHAGTGAAGGGDRNRHVFENRPVHTFVTEKERAQQLAP